MRGVVSGGAGEYAWEVTPGEVARRMGGDTEGVPDASVAHRKEPPSASAWEGEGVGVLLDCRTAEEVAIARVEGAVWIPLGELAQRVGELPGDWDTEVVVMCHHGVRSLQAVGFLRQQGYERAASMTGGIDRWSVEVDAGVPRY